MRAIGKVLAHRTGAMRAYHSRRNAATLTVLMFHRILPKSEIVRLGADPVYTATPQFLSDCISFLREHYAVVSLEDVLLSLTRAKPLPPRAALITFDDGWHDNLQHALPALGKTPWALFVTADALLEPNCWWQEVLLWAVRSGAADSGRLWQAAGKERASSEGMDECEGEYRLLTCYATLSSNERDSVLAPYKNMLCQKLRGDRMMLSPGDLQILQDAGVGIGAHGASHMPLSLLPDAEADLRRARDLLTDWLKKPGPIAMSFPHGRYNNDVMKKARDLQYRLLFSSDPILNRCEDGWIDSDILGRIPVDMRDVADMSGRLAPHKLAAWLFLREIGPQSGVR